MFPGEKLTDPWALYRNYKECGVNAYKPKRLGGSGPKYCW